MKPSPMKTAARLLRRLGAALGRKPGRSDPPAAAAAGDGNLVKAFASRDNAAAIEHLLLEAEAQARGALESCGAAELAAAEAMAAIGFGESRLGAAESDSVLADSYAMVAAQYLRRTARLRRAVFRHSLLLLPGDDRKAMLRRASAAHDRALAASMLARRHANNAALAIDSTFGRFVEAHIASLSDGAPGDSDSPGALDSEPAANLNRRLH